MSQIIIIIMKDIMKVTSGESKRRKIQLSDRLRIFFWVSYDVSHEVKTRAPKILRGENFERVSRTAITIVQNAIVGQV